MTLAFTVPGFEGNQTALNPVGPGAAHIEHTFSLIFWITSSVYCLVLLVLVVSVWRKRWSLNTMPLPMQTTPRSDRRATQVVGASMVVTVVLLFVMLLGSFLTSRAMGNMNNQEALPIEVYAHQWWWEVHYPNEEADHIVTTANEIHLPVGVPIRIYGTSRDVIHSFWAPNVQGKRDFLPGYNTEIVMQVNQPGRWRGQCAEFCGHQHAHMSFYMVAESKADFERWRAGQLLAAPDPATPQVARGQQLFLSHPCVMCHSIAGTSAGSRVGPDLTHVASRSTIAAGELENNIGNLGGWIMNAQSIKPGSRMPPQEMTGAELQDLLAYMETLR